MKLLTICISMLYLLQHEVVCSRSVNTESEEHLFRSAEAAKCTDRNPENMLPGLKRL